jgi:hypothetical protein
LENEDGIFDENIKKNTKSIWREPCSLFGKKKA